MTSFQILCVFEREVIKLKKRILVLCALPYTNNVPHVGNIVGSHLPADIFARFCRLRGWETVFIGGTDENGTPTEIASLELGITPKLLTDTLHDVHKKIYDWFLISYDNFSRTSKPIHHKTTQEIFLRIYENGYVSEGKLKLPFCEKDNLFLPDRYVEGICPYCGNVNARGDQCEKCTKLLDPDRLISPRCKICGSAPKIVETKHLFLNLDKLESKLEKWIKGNKHWKEQVTALALGWLKEGLKPRCITRDLKWGVKVPLKEYENKTLYVWFDAPIGYISSTKEWAEKVRRPKEWEKYWKGQETKIYNFLGKDNIPFHTIFWPSMLIADGRFNLPYQVIGLQYCNYEGGKISKSKNWGVFCEKIPEAGLDVDIWRYYFTHVIPEMRDSDFKWKEFEERINNELVANLGNFIHRTLTFIWNNFDGKIPKPEKLNESDKRLLRSANETLKKVGEMIENVRLRDGISEIIAFSIESNKYFQENEPWRGGERSRTTTYICASICKAFAILIAPYLPKSSERLWHQLNLKEKLSWHETEKIELEPGHRINKPKILFKKIERGEIEKVKKIVTKITPLEEFFKSKKGGKSE